MAWHDRRNRFPAAEANRAWQSADNLKSWPAAVKHKKRSASFHPLNDIPQAGAQLLRVYRFDRCLHVHLKMNFDAPKIKRRLQPNENCNSWSRRKTGAALLREYREKYDTAGFITPSLTWRVWMMCAEDWVR